MIELLGDMGHVASRFFLFVDSVSASARWVHGLRYTYHWLKNHFEHTRWYHSVTRLKWKLVSVFSDKALILTQDRCTVCVERTIGSEIILDAPDGTPR
jgi:hypothetical protein